MRKEYKRQARVWIDTHKFQIIIYSICLWLSSYLVWIPILQLLPFLLGYGLLLKIERKPWTGRVLVGCCLSYGIAFLCAVPTFLAFWFARRIHIWTQPEKMWIYFGISLFLFFFSIFLFCYHSTIMFVLPFAIGWKELGLKETRRLMKGKRRKGFAFICSFLPWYFLTFFTGGILFIWILPYFWISLKIFIWKEFFDEETEFIWGRINEL